MRVGVAHVASIAICSVRARAEVAAHLRSVMEAALRHAVKATHAATVKDAEAAVCHGSIGPREQHAGKEDRGERYDCARKHAVLPVDWNTFLCAPEVRPSNGIMLP